MSDVFLRNGHTAVDIDNVIDEAVRTAGAGLEKSGTTLNHSNRVSAKSTQSFAQISYDTEGHITGSTDATTAQLAAVNSGITSEGVAQIKTNKNNISYIANNNVINIFSRAAETYTHNGVTFTTNIDGSISLSGTATNAAGVLVFSSELDTTDDTYILYGDGFIEGVYMDTYETGWANQRTFTTWVETIPNTKIWRLIVSKGTNANNVTIRPMMCKKSLFDGLYHQPAISNVELTADVASLTAKSQKTISSSGNTSKLRLTLNTPAMSNANRGSLLLSIPFQTSSYDNALLLIAIGDDSFLGVQRLDNSNNSMVTSWALSENNTILDITLRAQPWSAPVAFPLAQVTPPITYSWES